jgi:hypothetical protein
LSSGSNTIVAGLTAFSGANNPAMIELKKLSPKFEAANPGIKLNWVVFGISDARCENWIIGKSDTLHDALCSEYNQLHA